VAGICTTGQAVGFPFCPAGRLLGEAWVMTNRQRGTVQKINVRGSRRVEPQSFRHNAGIDLYGSLRLLERHNGCPDKAGERVYRQGAARGGHAAVAAAMQSEPVLQITTSNAGTKQPRPREMLKTRHWILVWQIQICGSTRPDFSFLILYLNEQYTTNLFIASSDPVSMGFACGSEWGPAQGREKRDVGSGSDM
jgi:hypothetical protein